MEQPTGVTGTICALGRHPTNQQQIIFNSLLKLIEMPAENYRRHDVKYEKQCILVFMKKRKKNGPMKVDRCSFRLLRKELS